MVMECGLARETVMESRIVDTFFDSAFYIRRGRKEPPSQYEICSRCIDTTPIYYLLFTLSITYGSTACIEVLYSLSLPIFRVGSARL